MNRYIKNKSDGIVLLSMDENYLSEENALNYLTSRNLSPSDFEILTDTLENINVWIEDYTESTMTYEEKRKREYPSIVDQLDDIYHNGIDGWKATIKETKDKYPKV